MRVLEEETFRAALDGHGILREGALALPERGDAFTVFAQRPNARIEIDEWRRHSERFFGTRIGLTVDKRYDDDAPPLVDAARIVVVPTPGEQGTRTAWGRPRVDADVHAADRAESSASATGLAQLARRCGYVWLVEVNGENDAVALRLAAILAGILLGPILSPGAASIFGPKSARARLAELEAKAERGVTPRGR